MVRVANPMKIDVNPCQIRTYVFPEDAFGYRELHVAGDAMHIRTNLRNAATTTRKPSTTQPHALR